MLENQNGNQEVNPLRPLLLFSILFCTAVFAARFYFAFDSSFWCDEIGWIIANSGKLKNALEFVRTEPSPHGPLTVAINYFTSRILLALGAHPHIAIRIDSLFYSIGTTLLIWPFRSASLLEKFFWTLWSLTQVAICSSSLNFRPYSGLIFYAASALLVTLFYLREPERTSWYSLFCLALSTIGGLHHPYFYFAYWPLLFFLKDKELSVQNKKALFTSFLVSSALLVTWYGILRVPVAHTPSDIIPWWQRFLQAPWIAMLNTLFHALCNIGSPATIVLPFLIFGFLSYFQRTKKGALYIFFVSAVSSMIPFLLDIKYGYFFVPRQSLAALPFIGWFFVCAGVGIVNLKQKPSLKAGLLCAFLFFSFALPFSRWCLRLKPYFDVPHYRVHQFMGQSPFDEAHKIVVLSACHIGAAEFYSSRDQFNSFFSSYLARNSVRPPQRGHILQWTRDSISCGGIFPQKSTFPELEADVLSHPQNFVLFSQEGVIVPQLLQGLPCKTETNRPCTFANTNNSQ